MPEARGDAQKEILQAEAYRDQVTARAEGEAQRFNKLLAEYRNAKQVTRDRLYIDAMETVLSHSTKILVDVKGANNMLYLPLDRLMQQMNATPAPTTDTNANATVVAPNDRAATRRTSR